MKRRVQYYRSIRKANYNNASEHAGWAWGQSNSPEFNTEGRLIIDTYFVLCMAVSHHNTPKHIIEAHERNMAIAQTVVSTVCPEMESVIRAAGWILWRSGRDNTRERGEDALIVKVSHHWPSSQNYSMYKVVKPE